MRIRR